MSTSPDAARRAPSFAHLLAWVSMAFGALTLAFASTQTTEGQQRLADVRALYAQSPVLAFVSTGPRTDMVAGLDELERMGPRPIDPQLEQRLAALETAIGPFTGSIAPQPDRGFDTPQPDRGFGASEPVVIDVPPFASEAATPPVDWPPLEVPGVADAPSVTIETTEFAVDLAGTESLAGSQALWEAISAEQPELLGDLQPAVIARDSSDGALGLRLIAGPIRNAADAAMLCAKLKDRGRTCTLAVFNGQKLAMR